MVKTLFFQGLRLWISALLLIILSALVMENSQTWADITVNSLLDCSNTIREDNKRPPLYLNTALQHAARAKLQDMESYGYWAHQNPETGKMPWHFVSESGYPYLSAGENLAIGFSIGDHVCEAWEKSPPHFANLIDQRFQEVGFSAQRVNLGEKKGILIVQLLGSRPDFQSPKISPELSASIINTGSLPLGLLVIFILSSTLFIGISRR